MNRIIYKNMIPEESDKNIKELVEIASQHKNELILVNWNVCLLLDGIFDDGEDYYWRIVEPNEGLVYYSCVGRIEYLKDKIDVDSYEYIWNLFKLNYTRWKLKQENNIKEEYIDTLRNNYKEIDELFL